MKILVIFGTRPEAIKLIPVIKELEKNGKEFQISICITGQHKQMLNSILKLFSIKADYDLKLMKNNQSLFDVTVSVLESMEEILKVNNPDYVLVQGDTTTAFASALASYYLKKKVAHVEAGLRTMDKYAPFPEEINRKFIDYISDICFAPTKLAAQNLIKENIPENRIFITGNTVVDALELILQIMKGKGIQKKIQKQLLDKYKISIDERRLILVTVHRRESFGTDIETICMAIKKLANKKKDIQIIFPVHLNPKVKIPVYRMLGGISNICLTKPLDYLSFIWLMSNCYFILTDSGGIQEEAPALGKPVLVMREVTERPEGVWAGVVKLVGPDRTRIVAEVRRLLDDQASYQVMAQAVNPYGDGSAGRRIAEI